MKPIFYAVFEWTNRDNGWYDLADAVGARVFKTERGAVAFKLHVLGTSLCVPERGYVIRPSTYVKDHGGIVISKSGRITMGVPCTCRQAHVDVDIDCPYHAEHKFSPSGAAYPRDLYCGICGASETDHRL